MSIPRFTISSDRVSGFRDRAARGDVRDRHRIGERIDHRFGLARPRLTVGDARRRVIPRSAGVVKR